MNRLRILTLRTFFLALVVSFAALFVVLARSAAQNPPAQGKKKPPPGASGFEQFAGRDAADKLVKGAGTRRSEPPPPIIMQEAPLPDTPREAAAKLAAKHLEAGNFEAAIVAYKEAIKLSADAPADERAELHYALGKVYREMERYEDALAEFQTAANSPPASEIALYANYELGNAYLDVGKYREAIAAYEKTLQFLSEGWARTDPPLAAEYLPYPHYSKGLAHLGLKQKEEAAASFAKAIELKPNFAEAHFNLGLTLWQLGRKTEAWERQKKLSEVNAELAARLAALFK
ncbi:MAG TPA: tetratricopeptide repeat protein [Pyrinomonadaceae bacterium]|nr:tetratricopeptide repeat protein [Pyrinomonadaceae bacterium]